MKAVQAHDDDGDLVTVNRDERGVWIEVSECVGNAPVTTACAGPFEEGDLRPVRRILGSPAPLTRVGRGIAWLSVVAGPCAWLCGLQWHEILGPWAAAMLAGAVVAVSLVDETP